MSMEHQHDNFQDIVKAITRNLKEFGYTDLTYEQTLDAYNNAMTGQSPKNIIDMMVKHQLDENGLLPGQGVTTDF